MRGTRRFLTRSLLALCLAVPLQAQEPVAPEPASPVAPEPASPAGGMPVPPDPVPPEQAGGAPPAPAPAAAPEAPETAPESEVLEFQLKFPEEEGGGSASGSALSLEYQRDNYAVLTGEVKIRYQDIEMEADRAELDLLTKIVTAMGHVVLDQGPRRLAGETLVFDLDTKTGTLTNATAHVAPDYYFSGSEVSKVAEDVYTVKQGVFTSCSQEVPDWSFRLEEARVQVDGYARVRDATLRAKKLPVFYTPYILWPVKSDRTSGLLIPNIGYSDRRGASLGLAYYQTLGRSYDTTFHLDLYSEEYLGIGNELRYRPSEGTRGQMLGYMVRDPEFETFGEDEWRWKLEWSHETTDLPWNMRGVVQFQDYSDFNFFRDFERDFDRNTLRFIDSRAFVTRNWGPHLLNILVNDRETFIGTGLDDATVEQRKLPEVEYRLRSTRVGRLPLYIQFQGSASYLDLVRPGLFEGRYGRVDAFPQLTLPIRSVPWLSLSLTGGERVTWYSDSVESDPLVPGTRRFAGDPLTRALPFGSAEIVGPSFSRIFDSAFGFDKIKHVVEPRWTYTYLGEVDDLQEIPLFDELDVLRSTNQGRLALVNRVLAKPEGQESAREVFFFELARRISFDDKQPLLTSRDGTVQSNEGPLEALARFSPTASTSIKLEADYDTLFRGISSTQLSGELGLGKGNFLALSWFTRFQPELDRTLSNQVRFGGSLGLFRNVRVEGQINYDVEEQLLQQQRYILYLNQQCYGLRLELRDFRAGVGARTRDKDFRFSLTLKNVGTFLDLTSRSSTVEP